MISPSQFACTAAGIKPTKSLPKHTGPNGCCMFCGVAIKKGDKVDVSPKMSNNFVDWPSLAAPGSDLSCWGCHEVRRVENGMLQLGAKALYAKNAVFKAHSRAEQAYHIYHPPNGPFVFVQAIAKSEHIVWKTPVAYGPDRFPVRVGPHLLMVDRKRVLAALQTWKKALTALHATGKYQETQQMCEIMDPDLREPVHMKVKPWLLNLELPEISTLEETLAGMSMGDHWALSILVIYHNKNGYDAVPKKPARLFN
jgi:CRISPR type IV-associated protein Csf1